MNESPVLKVVLVVAIVLAAASFFYWPKPKDDGSGAVIVLDEAVGYVAAKEAAKVLGEKGGGVVLIVPGREEKFFRDSVGEFYERGFKKAAAKHPTLRLKGHFLGDQPTFQKEHQHAAHSLGLETLHAAREKFPDATLLVSFIGIPQLEANDIAQWQSASPLKMIALHNATELSDSDKRQLSAGVVQVLLLAKPDTPLPDQLKGAPREIFDRFYRVITSP